MERWLILLECGPSMDRKAWLLIWFLSPLFRTRTYAFLVLDFTMNRGRSCNASWNTAKWADNHWLRT